MTQLGAQPRVASPAASDSPADALAAVVENVTALARAELRLALMEARAWSVRIFWGLGLLWLALLLAQVLVLLLALAPVMLQSHSWSAVGATLALALLPTLGVGAFAVRALSNLKEQAHGPHGNDQH